ncbi:MAG: PDZ domain-containing protein, partial [Gemmatimonadales bacterium]
MRRFSIIAFTAAVAGSAAVASAQQPAPATPAPRPRAVQPGGDMCTSDEAGRIECRKVIERRMDEPGETRMWQVDSAMMKRAALGMQLSATGSARDTLGVFVAAVSPKGPAENAGIVEGDRIVSINGVDLRVAAGDVEDGYASGLPSHRLQREVGKLPPGAKVNVRVYAGGRVRDVQVTAGRASDLMRSRVFGNFGEVGPGNMFIYRDGMPGMPPMPPMADMQRMHMMMPGMEQGMKEFDMRSLPRMRMMEGDMGSRESRILEPGT